MRTKLALVLAVGLGLVGAPRLTSVCWGDEPPQPVSGIAADARLQTRARSVVLGRPIARTLRECATASGVDLQTDSYPGEQKLILVTRSPKLGPVLHLLAEHFQYTWKPLPAGSGNAPAPIGYRLIQSPARARLAAALRIETKNRRDREMARRVALYLRALEAGPDELEQLRAQDSAQGIWIMEHNRPMKARMQLMGLLSPAERAAVLAGNDYLSPPYDRLPASAQQVLDAAFGTEKLTAEEHSRLAFRLRRSQSDGSEQLMISFGTEGPQGRWGSGGSVMPGIRIPNHEGGATLPRGVLDVTHEPKNPALLRDVELLTSDGKPLLVSQGLPVLLEALSRASEKNVLSDHYSDPRLQYEPEPLGRRPLWQILNILGEQYDLDWALRDDFLLFRHRNWFDEEQREIPETVLEPWRSAAHAAPRATVSEFYQVLGTLTDPQMQGLGALPWKVSPAPPYAWERFLATLTPSQLSTLLAGTELGFSRLSAGQRNAVAPLAALAAQGPVPLPALRSLRVRLTPSESVPGVLQGSVTMGDRTARYAARLPAKQPLPPEILLELQD